MKQYKLIREYPNSPELGEIVTWDEEYELYESSNYNMRRNEIEGHPDFWKDITIDNKYIVEYSNLNKIGSVHWFNTIGGIALRNAEFIKNKPEHENVQKYAQTIFDVMQDFFTAHKDGLIRLKYTK